MLKPYSSLGRTLCIIKLTSIFLFLNSGFGYIWFKSRSIYSFHYPFFFFFALKISLIHLPILIVLLWKAFKILYLDLQVNSAQQTFSRKWTSKIRWNSNISSYLFILMYFCIYTLYILHQAFSFLTAETAYFS